MFYSSINILLRKRQANYQYKKSIIPALLNFIETAMSFRIFLVSIEKVQSVERQISFTENMSGSCNQCYVPN